MEPSNGQLAVVRWAPGMEDYRVRDVQPIKAPDWLSSLKCFIIVFQRTAV
jgi:hypothetical protein